MGPMMAELLAALDASSFLHEYRRCGERDGASMAGELVWMACSCGADIVHSISIGSPRCLPDTGDPLEPKGK